MTTEISIIVKPEDEHNSAFLQKRALEELENRGIPVKTGDVHFVQIKKSIDARHGQVKLCLRYKAYIGETPEQTASENALPVWKKADTSNENKRVLIIGSGPAGLFGALRLLEDGIQPVIIERGSEVIQRGCDIAAISTKGVVDGNSNYCFGEGGAGTFSDGKLYTRSNKRGNIGQILQIFVHFGANPNILTDAHPHIGTDKLPKIISAMRKEIENLGGKFYFNTKCTGFLTEDNSASAASSGKNEAAGKTVCGITAENTAADEKIELRSAAVLLAAGHSASDMYKIIAKTAPEALEAKTFATGVRVEHPRELIDAIQYHGQPRNGVLPTAEYRLTTQVDGRGVYSFCMCPGGFVVPSATGPDEIVINGMSPSSRSSKWSNAAIVVETRPEDIPEEFADEAKKEGCGALAGLLYRTSLEKETKKHGKGQKAPAQRLSDFLDGKESKDLPESSYTPGVVSSRLDVWLPPYIKNRLAQGFKDFNKNMHGFICPDALLIASETRTSTPVRILRDKDSLECVALKNLYPAGEGSGYSGGIVSSAMDGENACGAIAKKIK